jgi:hypothetical protein
MNVDLTFALTQRSGIQSVRFGPVDLYTGKKNVAISCTLESYIILCLLQDNFVLHYELVEKRPALPSIAQNVR